MSKTNRSATDRLNDVEGAVMQLFQTLDNMTRDLMLVKDAIKLLGNKVDSVVKVISSGGALTDDAISAAMVENNVAELTNKVADLVKQGVLVGEGSITAQSFVVLREINEDGSIVNPRLQFTMASLQPETAAKLLGALPGQKIVVQEGKLTIEILESFAIQGLTAAPAAEQVAAEAPAQEVASS